MGLCDCPEGRPHVLVALLCHQPQQELLRTAPGHVASGKIGFTAWPEVEAKFPPLTTLLALKGSQLSSEELMWCSSQLGLS